jgi:hypothetical protein
MLFFLCARSRVFSALTLIAIVFLDIAGTSALNAIAAGTTPAVPQAIASTRPQTWSTSTITAAAPSPPSTFNTINVGGAWVYMTQFAN